MRPKVLLLFPRPQDNGFIPISQVHNLESLCRIFGVLEVGMEFLCAGTHMHLVLQIGQTTSSESWGFKMVRTAAMEAEWKLSYVMIPRLECCSRLVNSHFRMLPYDYNGNGCLQKAERADQFYSPLAVYAKALIRRQLVPIPWPFT